MNVAAPVAHGVLASATVSSRTRLSRLAKSGAAMRLAPGLYAIGATLSPEQVARHHLLAVVAMTWPEGVLCGRTALAGGVPVESVVFVSHPDPPRRTVLHLPGIDVIPVTGPGALPGDMALPEGLSISGPARVLVENVDVRGRPARSRAGAGGVEDRIDDLARSGGVGRIRLVLDQLDVIAPSFDPRAVGAVRARLRAVLGSFSADVDAASDRFSARLSVAPFDAQRIDMLNGLVAVLQARAPVPNPIDPPASRWEWLAFFEAYFSNFIEGTEFGVDEARRIAVEGAMPAARPEDAHDVIATYGLAIDSTDRVRIPASGDDLIEILRARHRSLMAARPDKRPGEFKEIHNYAGGFQFVAPLLVEGTLTRGFDLLNPLSDPFARAAAVMALVTECHPFDDGNGRVARLTSNAELSSAGEVRIVIPIVYRNSYLAGLRAFSNGAGRGESLVAVLEYGQRWAKAVDWSSFEAADRVLTACNAYLDSSVAEANGQRLLFPHA
jgi:fido (protein-threonine AMPylation protein)